MNQPGKPVPNIGDLSADGCHYWDSDIWQWQPLWLMPNDVIDAVRHRFERSVTSACFLAAGLLNQSWRVNTNQETYVLRVSRAERSCDQITYEHAFIREMKKHVSVVIPSLSGRDGETIQHWQGRILTLFPFIEGANGSVIDPDHRTWEAATALARIHRASLDHIQFGQRPGFRAVDEQPRWIWSKVRPVLRRDLADAEDLDDLCDILDREIASLNAWLDDVHASQRPLPRATVHGDFNPRNLIFRDSRLVAVIDWDECHVGPIAWEVARVGFGEPDVDPSAFWPAYLDAGGPLSPHDLHLFGGFARMSALSELQWTVKDERATPHAIQQLRELVAGFNWLYERGADLAKL